MSGFPIPQTMYERYGEAWSRDLQAKTAPRKTEQLGWAIFDRTTLLPVSEDSRTGMPRLYLKSHAESLTRTERGRNWLAVQVCVKVGYERRQQAA